VLGKVCVFVESNQNKIWEIILGEVELSVPPATFKTWFEKASLLSVNDQHVSILVNNIFAKGQFETKYDAKIKQILVDNGFSKPTIEYIVNNKKAIRNEAVIQIDEPTVSVASRSGSGNRKTGLNPRYRFDNFIVGTCNDLAHAAAQAAASMPGQKYNPIFIYGGSGLGKTHLIQAIGNEIIAAHPEKRVLYVPTETFVNEFIDHVRYKKNRDFSKKYREVDVLIVDDERLQKINTYLLLMIHDEVICECPKEHVAEAIRYIKEDMENAAAELPVPFKADAETAECWYGSEIEIDDEGEIVD
jgi:chromosomal replication initiator protein